ncbi:GmrSD restriction endonuclease domain-containing protein [Scardovia inopinata]|uniref:GmrSD restriction endonuclease domain-containing protein n=1 Tax=Scardovia inopinata TaxID=78259 RepID=UPI0001D09895|nr:DUF1524 domain-containing protein [Scardovia inopinata]
MSDGASSGTLATVVLAALAVKGRAPKTGYSRAKFSKGWEDVDYNGCDTRNDILDRDLIDKTYKDGTHDCVVLTGILHDPYTGQTIHFRRGQKTSRQVQIDHVVALSDAWQTGAQQIDADLRKQLANDPFNLLAVQGAANEQKSDGDAATWLPANKSYRCSYVARQIGVKHKYNLWVTAAEKNAMSAVLSSCPSQTIPADSGLTDFVPYSQKSSKNTSPSSSPPSASSKARTTTAPKLPPAPRPTPKPAQPTRPTQRYTPQPRRTYTPSKPTPRRTYIPPRRTYTPPRSSGSGSNVYYPNCAAVRAAGKAPLYRGQPGYSAKLDRDHDGVACE